jgi:hypothetical protein
MTEAASGVGERRGDGMQAVEPDGAARRVRCVWAGAVVTLAVGAVVVARPVAVLAVLGTVVERFARRARASVVRLAVGARRPGALRASVQRGGAVAGVVGPLLAIVGLAVMARRAARVAAAVGGWPAGAAAVAAGMGRFHRQWV